LWKLAGRLGGSHTHVHAYHYYTCCCAQAYEAGGAACLSVLTDEKYFQGSYQNLVDIRAAGVTCPLLCKEFVVEAYQVYKARARCGWDK